jgi:hypothetical protein
MLMFKIAIANRVSGFLGLATALILVCVGAVSAQTTSFTYQGRLTDGGTPANGAYEIQFTLWDSMAGGTQQPQPAPIVITRSSVQVSAGAFTVQPLDFGATAFPGADRYLEISVRRNSLDPYTTLSPRQQITSTPYATRTLSAAQADVALDANKLGGVDASQYTTTTTIGNTVIKNSATQQTGATLNIDGNGTVGGMLRASEVRAQTATGLYGLTHTDGTTTVGTYVGSSTSGAGGGWFGTQSDSPLHFFTNNGQPQMSITQNGNVGIGTFNPQAKLQLAGNAAQDRASGGFVKAMLSVAANGTITQCYNGITGSTLGGCGFAVTAGADGNYVVNLGFQITDRFLSVSARGINGIIGVPPAPMSADFRFSSLPNANPNEVFIDTFRSDTRATANNPFMLIVY